MVKIQYEVSGDHGHVERIEARGKILEPICLGSLPVLAPLIIIEEASYGMRPEDVEIQKKELTRLMNRLLAIKLRKEQRLPVSKEQMEKVLLLSQPAECGRVRRRRGRCGRQTVRVVH